MKFYFNFLTVLIVVTIGACSSKTEQIKYYNLNVASNTNTVDNQCADNKKRMILFQRVLMPKYLRQGGLIIQIGKFEVQTAQYHRWSEPLDEAVRKFIMNRLDNTPCLNYVFVNKANLTSNDSVLKIRIEFDRFHITDKGLTVANGHFWINTKKNERGRENVFDIRKELVGDGYLHAVEQLSLSLEDLSEQIRLEL